MTTAIRYYQADPQQWLIEQLLHSIRFTSDIIVLRGDPGMGRSTILALTADQAQDEAKVLRLSGRQSSLPLKQQIDIQVREHYGLINVEQLRDSARAQEQLCYLLIDDADCLSADDLADLGQYFSCPDCRLLLVTNTHADIRKLLPDLPSIQELFVEKLPLAEYTQLIHFNLQQAGVDVTPDDSRIREVYQSSAGSLAQAMEMVSLMAAKRVPLSGGRQVEAPSAHSAWINHAKIAVAIIAVLGLSVTMMSYLYRESDNVIVEIRSDQQDRHSGAIKREARVHENKGADAQAVSTPLAQTQPVTRSAIIKPSQEIKEPVVQPPKSEAKPDLKATSTEQTIKTVKVEHDGAVTRIATKLADDAEKILTWDDSGYIIQLLVAEDVTKVNDFGLLVEGLLATARYQRLRNGQYLTVVVSYPYPSKDAAREAIAKLPYWLKQQGPWLKAVSAVKNEIRSAI